MSALLSGLALLAALSGSVRAAQEAYVTDDPNDARNEPPQGGGNGWLGGADMGRGATVNPGQKIWIACRNHYNPDGRKTWDLTLTVTTGVPGDIVNLDPDVKNAVGFDDKGKAVNSPICISAIGPQNANTGIRPIHTTFSTCPEWERIPIVNKANFPITFTIGTQHNCIDWRFAANTIRVESLIFCAATGATPTNHFFNQVMMFPQMVALDLSTPPTFSAPSNSGNWTIYPVNTDPDGNDRPLGGFVFLSDGPGLDPSQSCAFSFAMQGPAADLQYTMYAYDQVSQEFQHYDLDLRPTLSIASSDNAVNLQFDSILGLNYLLESSTDFQTWQPGQTLTGTGGTISNSSAMTGPAGFFRLRCFPSPIDVTPPTLSAMAAAAFRNSLVLSFSEPVNSVTATNRPNYFVGNNSGPIPILSVSQVWSRAVKLTLATTLAPGSAGFLGVQGVTDLSGNAMAPTSLQFTATTLQTPCVGGTLLAQQAYSECNPDGFWHVVEDDWYRCPDGTTQKFRVADTKTTEPCGPVQTAPSVAGLLYPTATDVASTCQSPVLLGQVQVRECLGGLWSLSTYMEYRCLDGTIYLSGPVQNVPMNPPTPCDQPPPPMPAP